MGKTKAGGSPRVVPSRDEDETNSNESCEAIEGPLPKKRKVEVKQKNGTSSNGSGSQKSGSQTKPVPEVPQTHSSMSVNFGLETVDGNAADRIKTASLCRQRKQVERFVVTTQVSSRDKPIIIPEGNGTKLQNISYIAQQINNARTLELLKIHKLIFGRIGIHAEVKQHLKSFSGFSFAEDSTDYEKKKQALIKMEKPERDFLCDILGLNKSGNKENVVDNILEFLMTPSVDLIKGKSKGKETKSPSPKKESKTTAVATSPTKKKSPKKSEPKKIKIAISPKSPKGKGKKLTKKAASSPKNQKKQQESPKSKSQSSPKKKATIKPVVTVKKAKKSPKKSNMQSVPEEEEEEPDHEMEEKSEDVSSDIVVNKDEEELGREEMDDAPSPEPETKPRKKSPVKVKPSFKSKAKSKNKVSNAFSSQPPEEDQDDEVLASSNTQ